MTTAERSSSGREELEAHRLDPGATGAAEAEVALERVVEAAVEQQPERDVERDDERHGRREGAVDLLLRFARAFPVEVEARQRRPGDLLPAGGRHGGGREPGRRHQRLLRAGDDDVEAPVVHLERHGAEARDGVDDDERTGLLGHRGERLNVRNDAGRGLGVDEEDERDRFDLSELAREILRASASRPTRSGAPRRRSRTCAPSPPSARRTTPPRRRARARRASRG